MEIKRVGGGNPTKGLVFKSPQRQSPQRQSPQRQSPQRQSPQRQSPQLGEINEKGSALPLLIGILLIALSAYMIAMNIYFLSLEKIKLERWGEDFVTDLYQEVAYQEYYFGNPEPYARGVRSFVGVDCNSLIQNLWEKFRSVPHTKSIIAAECTSSRIKISLSEEVHLPFIPQGLTNFQPKVIAHIEAGLQRVRTNR